jgi:uncharacterized membrane protein
MVFSVGLILYLTFCVLVGLCGSHRRMGFIGTFIISFFFTPVVVIIILLLTGGSRPAVRRGSPND